jgi:O-methyltransferase
LSLLGEHTRSVAATLYPRRLSIFDRLNSNVDFQAFVADAEPEASRFPNRLALYYWLNEYIHHEPVDYLEFGVAAGDSMRAWCDLNRNPESRFFGFDTFKGLPEDWTKNKPTGTFGRGGIPPEIADERVSFIKGLFQSTLYDFLNQFTPQRRLVVHIDCDIYSGALFCLAVLDRIMVPGSLLIFDEFYDLQNEFAAFQDYSCSFYREAKLLGYTNRIEQAAFALGEMRLPGNLAAE